jgi:hypothetical protein
MAQTLAQIWRKCSDDLVVQFIPFPMRGTTGKQDTLGHRLLRVLLEDAPWHVRGDGLKCLQVSFRFLHGVWHQSLLSRVETILCNSDIFLDEMLPPLGEFVCLRDQTAGEVVDPLSQIHSAVSHTLQCRGAPLGARRAMLGGALLAALWHNYHDRRDICRRLWVTFSSLLLGSAGFLVRRLSS